MSRLRDLHDKKACISDPKHGHMKPLPLGGRGRGEGKEAS